MQLSMQPSMRLVIAAALAALPLFSAPLANAQAERQSPGTPKQPGATEKQTPDIPDQKLDAAAVALEQVASVREKYRQRLEEAPATDAKGITDEAKNAIAKAITDQGLSIEEYTSILVVAQNDPVIREKIVQRIRRSDK
jgi:Domain of unknown function (DUF4168)